MLFTVVQGMFLVSATLAPVNPILESTTLTLFGTGAVLLALKR